MSTTSSSTPQQTAAVQRMVQTDRQSGERTVRRVRLGLLGAGRQGRNHARVFSTLRYADLVGIYDPNLEAACELAGRYDTACFSELEPLLDSVDAVSIATPTPWHHELAHRCLDRGLDVFVEKPFTQTVAQAEALAAHVARTDRILQVGHIERFNPAYTQLKHVVAGMTPLVINLRRLSCYVGSNTDVDVVLDLMIHDLDLAMDLAGGPPEHIEATGFTAFSGAIDHAIVQLKFPRWPMIALTASRVTEQKIRTIDVTALEAYTECDLLNKSVAIHHRTVGEYVQRQNGGGGGYRQESFVERIHVPSAEPLHLEMEHFIECVRTRKAPLVTAEHGVATLKLAAEVRRAIHHTMSDARALERRLSVVPMSVLPPSASAAPSQPMQVSHAVGGDD
ncbi:MAG: Gfo/Idh/MocA family oxidoreductase [Caldilineaceae bacterium]